MTKVSVPTVKTRTGIEIPQMGFGTYKVVDDQTGIIESAIDVGYRHLDTAQMYANEDEVGAAWVNSGIDRGEFFLTTKLDNPNHEPDVARRSFEKSLKDLRTDYVDLFLIHWPLPMYYDGDFNKTWAVLEEFVADGRARSIGVSNFEPHHLEQLFTTAKYLPEVNQIESHPYMQNDAAHAFDSKHQILTEAWSPLARGQVLGDPVLVEIGKAHGKTPSQVALRWALQRGDIVIPKASTRQRQEENIDVFDFELSDAEMNRIYALNKGEDGRTGLHPDKMDRLHTTPTKK